MGYGAPYMGGGGYGGVPGYGHSFPHHHHHQPGYTPGGPAGGNPYSQQYPPQQPQQGRKEGPDLYAALGLTKDAKKEEIVKEGKKLKMKWHPDRNKEKGAEEKFKLVNEATEVLSDEGRRKYYDQTGDTNMNNYKEWEKMQKRYENMGGGFGM
jgi:hypothetical protein